MEEESAHGPTSLHETCRIRRLPEGVINRIAAGEVVVRPSAALKELLENSLDAGASSITITVRNGGLKLLQVCDDGKGVSKEDLPLLCQRFATSKLRTFEDLAVVSTFGFRGEALASVSHVARLSLLTKTKDSDVAYKATYLDGVLRGEPEPTAGCDGTTMIIEDMFYNLVARRNALKSPSDEYRAVVDVVSRYAIRYPQVSFVCRRSQTGNSSRAMSAADVRTELCSTVTDNIRAGFGSSVANELLSFEVKIYPAKATVSVYATTANFSMKKAVFVLFINGRLIECQPLKRAVLAAYGSFLPKNGHPFVYADLKMRQADIDVNVHPTKKEVRFLNEQLIIEAVADKLIEKLKTTETSRTFLAQSVLATNGSGILAGPPISSSSPRVGDRDSEEEPKVRQSNSHNLSFASQDIKIFDELTVKSGALDEFPEPGESLPQNDASQSLPDSEGSPFEPMDLTTPGNHTETGDPAKKSTSSSKNNIVYAKNKVRTGADAPVGLYDVYLSRNNQFSKAIDIQTWRKRRKRALPLLTSVGNMLNECQSKSHSGLTQALKEHIFIGVASDNFVLLQHSTRLLLAEIAPIVAELMYQQILIRFADHDTLSLSPPAPLVRLIEGYTGGRGNSELNETADYCSKILMDKAPMLSEYFGISISEDGEGEVQIHTIPLLLPKVMPDVKYFGAFLYHLAVDTNWCEELECLQGISRAIAEWYGRHWDFGSFEGDETMGSYDENREQTVEGDSANAKSKTTGETVDTSREWLLRHIFFTSLRKDFYPPQSFYTEKIVREITSTARLYKVFERC